MHRLIAAILLSACCAAPYATAADDGSQASRASEGLAGASGVVVLGSMSVLAASGEVVVASVKAAGQGGVVVLKGVSNAAEVSLQVGAEVLGGSVLVTGVTLSVVAVSTGYVLQQAGKAVLYIPNKVGESLLHHQRVAAPGA